MNDVLCGQSLCPALVTIKLHFNYTPRIDNFKNRISISLPVSQPSFSYFTRVTLQYMFKPIVSGNFRPRPTSNFGGVQQPNNIFTNVPPKNNQGFPSQSSSSAGNNNPSYIESPPPYYQTNTPQPPPITDSSINLINSNNNFGLQYEQTTSRPPPQMFTRTQAPPVVTQKPQVASSK